MKKLIFLLVLSLALCACGGQSSGGEDLDTSKIEKPDSESIVELAAVMGRDLARFLRDDDIQSAAALCEEGLDNLMYFREIGDDVSAGICANSLHKFVKKHYDDMEDMATQNYIVKQFMAAVGDSAILNARRRRWPQEEEIRHEPTVEADGPAPSRPSVRHLRGNGNGDADENGENNAGYDRPGVRSREKKAVQKTVTAEQKPKETSNKAGAVKQTPQREKTAKPQQYKKNGQKKQYTNTANATASTQDGKKKTVARNSNTGKKKEPIIVKCKKTSTGKATKDNGEGASSQWYLVRPLD